MRLILPIYQLSACWKNLTALVDASLKVENWYLMNTLVKLNFDCKMLLKIVDMWCSTPLRVCKWWRNLLSSPKTLPFFFKISQKFLLQHFFFPSSQNPFIDVMIQIIDLMRRNHSHQIQIILVWFGPIGNKSNQNPDLNFSSKCPKFTAYILSHRWGHRWPHRCLY